MSRRLRGTDGLWLGTGALAAMLAGAAGAPAVVGIALVVAAAAWRLWERRDAPGAAQAPRDNGATTDPATADGVVPVLAGELDWLSLFAQRTSHALVMTDARRRITWVNEGFERLTGYDLSDVLGRAPGALLQSPETDPLAVQRLRQALDEARPCVTELQNRSRHGRLYWVSLDIQPLFDADGTLNGFISVGSDVTERRRSQEALHAQRALLDRTGRIAGVGGWAFDLRSQRFEWTAETAHILERDPDLLPSVRQCLMHCRRDHRRVLVDAVRRARDAREGWDLELPFLTANDQPRWVRLSAEAEFDDSGPVRIVGALQDVTQIVSMRGEVQRSAELLRGAIDTMDEAFVVYDRDDRLVFCNDRYRNLYATVADVLLPGTRFEDILRTGLARRQYVAAIGQEEAWLQRRLQAHRSCDGPQIQRLDNGRVVRVAERRMHDGHQVGFRVDITDLVQATEKAEAADRAKSEFIATISHELRTPLQSITGFSDLGRHFAAGHPQFEQMFDDIHAGGMRMLTLVNALLDISKFDGGLGQLQLRRADLQEAVQQVARELRPQAEQRALRIEIGPAPADPQVTMDVFRMQQVVRNVLANALRFSPPGGLIGVTLHDDERGWLRVLVRDQGPGIPQDELDKIFEPFVQSSRTRDGAGGTGLGLAICRRIMQAHGGTIEAYSPPDGGACLSIRVPRKAAHSPVAQEADPAARDSRPRHAANPGERPSPAALTAVSDPQVTPCPLS